jgi:filamentous hemagglutinin
MSEGFSNFRDLYNNPQDPVAWDIKQLHSEQQLLQPIHEKYLKDRTAFTGLSKILTNSDYKTDLILNESSTQPGGIDILDYTSRVQYGCKLLGYGAAQGCKP